MIDKDKRKQIAERVLKITRDWSGINNINENTRFVDLMTNKTKHLVNAFWKIIEVDFGITQSGYRYYVLTKSIQSEIKLFTTVGNLINFTMEDGELKEELLTREEVSAEVFKILSNSLDTSICEEDELLPAPDVMLNSWDEIWELIRARFRLVPSKKEIILFTIVGDIVDYVMENGDLSRNSDEKCGAALIPLEDVECRGRNGWFQFCEVNVSVIEPNVWVHFWSKRRGDNPPIAIDGPVDQVLKIFEGIMADIRGQMKGGNK